MKTMLKILVFVALLVLYLSFAGAPGWHTLYGKSMTMERFRHRYEINPEYVPILEKNGLIFSGASANGKIMEIAELKGKRFYFGTQFHPEFSSRLERPSPVFIGFVTACLSRKG